jgi:hypothetical protein
MPECVAATAVRERGGTDVDVRLVVTFTAAMDRARDADRLWAAAVCLHESSPWVFHPESVSEASLFDLADALRTARVTQRHGQDAAAWRMIAESLVQRDRAPAVHDAIYAGLGDARDLLAALRRTTASGTDLFPFLRGPKVGPMWVRMLAVPGSAQISSLEVVPVAVDVQVRRVTEYLGVTETASLDLEVARPIIQAAWHEQVRRGGTEGPGPLAGTDSALDPALWFWGKWGCSACERAATKMPIAEACALCHFPAVRRATAVGEDRTRQEHDGREAR